MSNKYHYWPTTELLKFYRFYTFAHFNSHFSIIMTIRIKHLLFSTENSQQILFFYLRIYVIQAEFIVRINICHVCVCVLA